MLITSAPLTFRAILTATCTASGVLTLVKITLWVWSYLKPAITYCSMCVSSLRFSLVLVQVLVTGRLR
jgi:hypothetical protein